MDRNRNETNVRTDNTRSEFPVYGDVSIPRSQQSYSNPKGNRGKSVTDTTSIFSQ